MLGATAWLNTAKAQTITGNALNGSLGGARILSTQGNTAANPAIGFTGSTVLSNPIGAGAQLNDGAGGNGIFRPASNSMAFATSGTERMRIYTGGQIGIGTGNLSPSTLLQLRSSVANDGITVQQTATSSASLSLQSLGAGGKSWTFFSSGADNANLGGAGNLAFWDGTAARLVLQGSTGNVGIGTITPSANLQVMAATDPALKVSSPSSSLLIGIASAAGNYSSHALVGDKVIKPEGTGSQVIFSTNTNTGVGRKFVFTSEQAKIMQILDNGKVVIGNATNVNGFAPGAYKLYVESGIITEKIKVSLLADWADYVFSPNYALKPLEEVACYIQENKHLPNIPSAEELQKGGLDLGEMQVKQMEKIEELTLYMIEMKKEIDLLKKEKAELKLSTSPSKH